MPEGPRWLAISAAVAFAGAGLFSLWRVLHPRTALFSTVDTAGVSSCPGCAPMAPRDTIGAPGTLGHTTQAERRA